MTISNAANIHRPPINCIVIFRRDLDLEIYYKTSDDKIHKIINEDGIFKIQSVAGFIGFKNWYNQTGEKIEVLRITSQEFFFKICEEPIVIRQSFGGGGGNNGGGGKDGKSGFSGFSGFSGLNGQAAASGYSGYSGYSGFSGDSGISGYSGFSGDSGISGYSGFSGDSGISGYSGFSGDSGISGYSGFSGISGYSGFSGISGYSGFSGISGYSGFSGISGFSGNTGQGGMFVYWNSGGNLANNNYLLYGQMDTTENHTQIVITKTSTVQNLYVKLTTAPGGVATRTFTIRKNGVNTALSVTITGAATTGSDIVDTVPVVAFDLISIIQTQAGGPSGATGIASVQVI